MDIKVNVTAPAIVEAINKLCEVFATQRATSAVMQDEKQITAIVSASAQQASVQAPTTIQPVNYTAEQNAVQETATAQQTPVNLPIQQPVNPNSTVSGVEYSRNQIVKAAARLIEQNKMPQVLALLAEFGVQAVTQLQDSQLPAFAEKLKTLGAVL